MYWNIKHMEGKGNRKTVLLCVYYIFHFHLFIYSLKKENFIVNFTCSIRDHKQCHIPLSILNVRSRLLREREHLVCHHIWAQWLTEGGKAWPTYQLAEYMQFEGVVVVLRPAASVSGLLQHSVWVYEIWTLSGLPPHPQNTIGASSLMAAKL